MHCINVDAIIGSYMSKKVVLKMLADDKYLTLKSEGEQKNSMLPCKYTFHRYDWLRIARFDTEEEALNAFADFCKSDKSVIDVAIVSVITEFPS